MKKVLVLGAGMVSKPLVTYLLDRQIPVTLADINGAQARAVLANRRGGVAVTLDIADGANTERLIRQSDMIVSMLPPSFHPGIAERCLANGRHFLCASYLGDAMRGFDAEARAKQLVFLNEVGLDPGLDHMTAMELIDRLRGEGYRITSFQSHCGGIPSRAAANNPLRYKFSWSPAGVLRALTRPSHFREKGVLQKISGDRNLQHAQPIHILNRGVFESTPNADSLYYGTCYGLEDAATLYRGTLRYPGWAKFWSFALDHGFLDESRKIDFAGEPMPAAFFTLLGMDPATDAMAWVQAEAPEHAAFFLDIIDQLGLLDHGRTLSGTYSAFSLMLERTQATMNYGPDEADLVILHHIFKATKDGREEVWTSTLVQEGRPAEKLTAMALLVGLPAAICVRLVLEGRISARGVMLPIAAEIYEPVLAELHEMGLGHQVQRHEPS